MVEKPGGSEICRNGKYALKFLELQWDRVFIQLLVLVDFLVESDIIGWDFNERHGLQEVKT